MDIDKHVDDPEEKERGVNTRREFQYKPRPLRMNRTDGDGLVGTQERRMSREGVNALITENDTSLSRALLRPLLEERV